MDGGIESRLTSSSFVCARVVPRLWRVAPDSVASVAKDSVLLRTIESVFHCTVVRWRHAATRRRIRAVVDGPLAPVAQRVRLGGWLALSAATTRVLLAGISDLAAPPGVGLVWVAVIPFAAACILKPQAVIAAWQARWIRVPTGLHANAQRRERSQEAPTPVSV